MSGVNPVVLIQLLMQYDGYSKRNYADQARTFAFTRNHRLIFHKETREEVMRRKSDLSLYKLQVAKYGIRDILKRSLQGKIGKVWIDPEMRKIAVPLSMSTGESGFGILPTGSRIKIPEGNFIRAFTYWEKVNDIDLSCFALTEDGRQEEFSWRNMWHKQDEEITFSGDQTSGYNGGSEYFDIDIDLFKRRHPDSRYIVLCDNVYSGINFGQCDCQAGFMICENVLNSVPLWKGERKTIERLATSIFDPRTVQTSFRINAESTFAYLFAIDLKAREMVWLNMARSDNLRVAGESSMDFLLRYLTVTDVFNVGDLYEWAGTPVDDPEEADVVVSDTYGLYEEDPPEIVRSWDFEKMLSLLQPK